MFASTPSQGFSFFSLSLISQCHPSIISLLQTKQFAFISLTVNHSLHSTILTLTSSPRNSLTYAIKPECIPYGIHAPTYQDQSFDNPQTYSSHNRLPHAHQKTVLHSKCK